MTGDDEVGRRERNRVGGSIKKKKIEKITGEVKIERRKKRKLECEINNRLFRCTLAC